MPRALRMEVERVGNRAGEEERGRWGCMFSWNSSLKWQLSATRKYVTCQHAKKYGMFCCYCVRLMCGVCEHLRAYNCLKCVHMSYIHTSECIFCVRRRTWVYLKNTYINIIHTHIKGSDNMTQNLSEVNFSHLTLENLILISEDSILLGSNLRRCEWKASSTASYQRGISI